MLKDYYIGDIETDKEVRIVSMVIILSFVCIFVSIVPLTLTREGSNVRPSHAPTPPRMSAEEGCRRPPRQDGDEVSRQIVHRSGGRPAQRQVQVGLDHH